MNSDPASQQEPLSTIEAVPPTASTGVPVCVIGMHRSGTSLVAHLLNKVGLDLGPEDAWIEAAESNPLGHFEHRGFLAINELILSHFGGTWENPPILEVGWEKSPALEPIRQQAALCLKAFTKDRAWGWKDPRTSLLIPFWKAQIPTLRCVICLRNPIECGKSLAKRDRMASDHAMFLWNRYTRSAIRDTEGMERLFVFYEDVLENPHAQVARLTAFCGLPTPSDLTPIREIVTPNFKHHTHSLSDLLSEEASPRGGKILYLGLRSLFLEGLRSVKEATDPERHRSEILGRFARLMEDEAGALEGQVRAEVDARVEAQLCSTRRILQDKLAALEDKHTALERYVEQIHASIAWKKMIRFYAWRDRVAPDGSLQRKICDTLIERLKRRPA